MLRLINAQPITYYKLDSNVKVNEKGSFDFTTTRNYILNSKYEMLIIIIFLSVICIAFAHQNSKLRIRYQSYRECTNCHKDRLWKDIFHAKNSCK